MRMREKLPVTGRVQVLEDVRKMRYQMAASTLLRVQRLLLLAKARSQRSRETCTIAQSLSARQVLKKVSGIDTEDVVTGADAILSASYASERRQQTCSMSSGRQQTTKHAYPGGPAVARVEPPPKMVCASERSLQRDHRATRQEQRVAKQGMPAR